jgi:hypothetical protein
MLGMGAAYVFLHRTISLLLYSCFCESAQASMTVHQSQAGRLTPMHLFLQLDPS